MDLLCVEHVTKRYATHTALHMSALARYFKAKGYKVAGYDRTLSVSGLMQFQLLRKKQKILKEICL